MQKVNNNGNEKKKKKQNRNVFFCTIKLSCQQSMQIIAILCPAIHHFLLGIRLLGTITWWCILRLNFLHSLSLKYTAKNRPRINLRMYECGNELSSFAIFSNITSFKWFDAFLDLIQNFLLVSQRKKENMKSFNFQYGKLKIQLDIVDLHFVDDVYIQWSERYFYFHYLIHRPLRKWLVNRKPVYLEKKNIYRVYFRIIRLTPL